MTQAIEEEPKLKPRFLGIDAHDLEILPDSETVFPDLRQLKSKIARLIQPVKLETTP